MSKFDWHDLSPIFFGHNASSIPKRILETNKTSFASYSLIGFSWSNLNLWAPDTNMALSYPIATLIHNGLANNVNITYI